MGQLEEKIPPVCLVMGRELKNNEANLSALELQASSPTSVFLTEQIPINLNQSVYKGN